MANFIMREVTKKCLADFRRFIAKVFNHYPVSALEEEAMVYMLYTILQSRERSYFESMAMFEPKKKADPKTFKSEEQTEAKEISECNSVYDGIYHERFLNSCFDSGRAKDIYYFAWSLHRYYTMFCGKEELNLPYLYLRLVFMIEKWGYEVWSEVYKEFYQKAEPQKAIYPAKFDVDF